MRQVLLTKQKNVVPFKDGKINQNKTIGGSKDARRKIKIL